MQKKFLACPILIAVLFSLALPQKSRAEFDPSFILSDEEYTDSSTMTLQEIQSFLNSKGGYLARYSGPNAFGITKTAAEMIYDAAANNFDCADASPFSLTEAQKQAQCKKISINPKLLLVLLQKEQSLIDDPAPRQSQLDWAVGYGCPDNQACNTRWQGFGKQVNSAALQFHDYIDHPDYYTFKAGAVYTVTNTNKPPMTIQPANQATAALYNYTPHVYNGNFNFYKLWQRWFTRSYPNGTLLQAEGDAGVWLLQNGQKRPFLSRGALTTRYDTNKIIKVKKSELDKYEKGLPIKYAQYSLVRSPKGNIYMIVGDNKRGIISGEVFRKIGFNPEEIIDASWDDLSAYPESNLITATSTYLTGALMQNKKTGGIYYVSEGAKAPLLDKIFLKTKFKRMAIIPVASEKLDSFTTLPPYAFGDGELLAAASSPSVYVIEDGRKRPIVSGEVFEGLGYKWNNVIRVTDKIIRMYPDGEPLKANTEESTAASSPDKNPIIIADNSIASSTNAADNQLSASSTLISKL